MFYALLTAACIASHPAPEAIVSTDVLEDGTCVYEEEDTDGVVRVYSGFAVAGSHGAPPTDELFTGHNAQIGEALCGRIAYDARAFYSYQVSWRYSRYTGECFIRSETPYGLEVDVYDVEDVEEADYGFSEPSVITLPPVVIVASKVRR
jgi:hypothetical protein